jgi:peptide/nickel transport system substrate-binding protein
VSLAADRAAMARLAFDGRATPIAQHVTPGNKAWLVEAKVPPRSAQQAQKLLREAGLPAGGLEFSLLVNAANTAQGQLATILQEDLRGVGIRMRIVPLEFRSLVERVTKSLDYEAALMGLGSGDADPNSEMNIWASTGSMHLWNLSAAKNPLPWEREIDRWMQQQRSTLEPGERKRAYGEVQKLVARHLPIIALVSPHLLVAHKAGLSGVRPGITPPYALWNIEDWSWGKH